MLNVLITGGAGFIGSNFIQYLLEKNRKLEIINLDALTYAGSLINLNDIPDPDRHIFIEGDICDQNKVEHLIREYRIDTIVHFAAESHVDRSISGPSPFIQTNIIGTFTLLEAARKIWLEESSLPIDQVRFHHVSTDEVYGSLEPEDDAFKETNLYLPNSPYAASKASSDHLVRAYTHTYDLPSTLTNCSNNYGPFQFPEKLIPLMILNAVDGKTLPMYGDGQQVRDWLYVKDHCEAILLVLEEGQTGETYNIGGENQPTNEEIVRLLCSILDERIPDSPHVPHESLITYVKDRPGHDRRYAMDISKIKADLGWSPKESLESGLRRTTDWYLSNTEWLEAIKERSTYAAWMAENYGQRGGVQ